MLKKYRAKYQKLIQYFRQARLEIGLVQIKAGKRLKKPQAYIFKIKQGERRIDAVELGKLARSCTKSLDYFVK